MTEKNTANVGFEKQIWDAACRLYGNIDPSEYKHVILGLVFLKYVSDQFEAKHAALVAEGAGFEEDPDEYAAENIFYVPKEARWSTIAKAAHSEQIGVVIDNAMTELEKKNKKLKGILTKNFARPELDKIKLGEVVDIFSNLDLTEKAEKDILGRVYEYCLREFALQEGKRGGQFFTPSCIVRTLVSVLKPFKGRVYDGACGSGGMFVQSAKFIEEHSGSISDISVYGQENNSTTWKIAAMNLAIHGIDANLGGYAADTFTNDLHSTVKFEYELQNPPFNMPMPAVSDEDQRWKYGVPPSGNANFGWMQHMIWHLSPSGKMGLVLANGSLSSNTGGEGEIRKNIIEDDLVYGIIALPSQLFYSTGIPCCLWFLTKHKAQPGKTLFIDARQMGKMVDRTHRELTEEDIQKIAATFDAYENGTQENVAGFCAVATTEEIAKQDYILTPGRYVGIEEQEDDGEPFDDKMKRLTRELSDLFAKSHELEEKIRKNLGAIGYEI